MAVLDDAKMKSAHARWAEFRFGVIGALLSAPPERGELNLELEKLSRKKWTHPITGELKRFGKSTIERWYRTALINERKSPVDLLRRKVRKDEGSHPGFAEALREIIRVQHARYPYWSYKLHYDNLKAHLDGTTEHQNDRPSYSTLKRYMQRMALTRRRRPKTRDDGSITPGAEQAMIRLEKWEVRSYEREHVGALWHLDFHHCSRKVLIEDGQWATPIALGVIDDHSRLLCHLQWYLAETTENLCHGVIQAIMRRSMPRELMSDNGAAMVSDEFTEGLMRLGITHERTLPHSPYQNGKQESFWGRLEGRLIAMLDRCETLTLKKLNDLSFAWAEREYNAIKHEETGEIPAERYMKGRSVLRASPSREELRAAFRREERRRQRQSDGTVTIEGRRFEVPGGFRHQKELRVRFARWDLSFVTMTDPRTGVDLSRLYPQDKAKNASAIRRPLDPIACVNQPKESSSESELPPLLQKLLKEQEKSGLSPVYLPKMDEQKTPSDLTD
jgi:putative transposase